jgi:hypothetical protein
VAALMRLPFDVIGWRPYSIHGDQPAVWKVAAGKPTIRSALRGGHVYVGRLSSPSETSTDGDFC